MKSTLKISTLIYILIGILFTNTLHADISKKNQTLEKVSLQLKWKYQFQFAGFIVAKERGFYADEGLDVELLEFGKNSSMLDVIKNRDIEFGVSDSSLIYESMKGASVVAMMAILQESPLVLLGLQSSELENIKDLNGKKISLNDNINALPISAMLKLNNIDYTKVERTYKLNKLFLGEVDLVSSYISNEPFVAKEMGFKTVVFDPKEYGFDGYGDILFTSKDMLEKSPKIVKAMYRASKKGWHYAFTHMDETVELIYKKYNSLDKSKEALKYEAGKLKSISCDGKNFGELNREKIKRVGSMINFMLNENLPLDRLDGFIYEPNSLNLSAQEREYLKNKKELTLCVSRNWLPYESYQDNKYQGIGADYIDLLTKKINLKYKVLVAENQSAMFNMLNSKECDIKAIFPKNGADILPYEATKTYIDDSITLVTRIEQPYIKDLKSINSKKILVAKGFKQFIKYLEKYYSKLELTIVDDPKSALKSVADGEAFGYIGTSLNSSYLIQKSFSSKLKIVNDFETFEFGIGVLESEPMLKDILNKTVESITEDQKRKILNRWVTPTLEKERDYTFVLQLLLVFALLLLVISYFLIRQRMLNRKLHIIKKELSKVNETLQERIEEAIDDLEKQNTELKKQKIELQESVEKFEHLFDTTMEMIIIYKLDGEILEINKQGAKFGGFNKSSEVIGRNILEFIAKKDIPIVQASLQKDRFEPYELSVHNRSGDEVNLLVAGLNIMRNSQEVRLSVAMDLTEIKQKEKQMLLHSRQAQMGEMLGMIAHQWRQPLGAIGSAVIGLKYQLASGTVDFKNQDDIALYLKSVDKKYDDIGKYVKFLSSTIDDFRNFFKPDKKRENVEITDPVDKAVSIVANSMSHHNIKILKEYRTYERVSVFQNELMQVILNILKNSEDNFIEKGVKNPQIDIVTKKESGTFIISISDNGGGITEDVLCRIFDPYFSTKDEKNGSGLGLYMSKVIVEEHNGGELKVKNREDGVCFEIVLKDKKYV